MKRILLSLLFVGILVGCTPKATTSPTPDTKQKETTDTNQNTNTETVEEEPTEELQTDQAPDFTLQTLDGKSVSLKDFRGKYVILNFWASWCPPCKKEMPYLQQAKEHFDKTGDTVILAINVTASRPDEKKNAVELIKKEGYTFPVLWDEEGKVSELYEVTGIPKNVFIDKEGREIGFLGPIEKGQAEEFIEQLKEGNTGGTGNY